MWVPRTHLGVLGTFQVVAYLFGPLQIHAYLGKVVDTEAKEVDSLAIWKSQIIKLQTTPPRAFPIELVNLDLKVENSLYCPR